MQVEAHPAFQLTFTPAVPDDELIFENDTNLRRVQYANAEVVVHIILKGRRSDDSPAYCCPDFTISTELPNVVKEVIGVIFASSGKSVGAAGLLATTGGPAAYW
jgi:hypothetical protein